MKRINKYINMKHINTYILSKIKKEANITEKLKISKNKYSLFPETRDELVEMIKEEIKQNGNECDLNHIDTSKITDMSFLFSGDYDLSFGLNEFNGDISCWNVSNVEDMHYMFENSDFNQDINNWDVSNVINMECMFSKSKFNQPLDNWNVSNVKNMFWMFSRSNFNQPLKYWDVSNVKDMECMFKNSNFNQDISNWKINDNCKLQGIFWCCKINKEYIPKVIKVDYENNK